MLLAGLTTPLPASLTGDARSIDKEEVILKGTEALQALETILGSGDWALGAT
jgi:metaxin